MCHGPARCHRVSIRLVWSNILGKQSAPTSSFWTIHRKPDPQNGNRGVAFCTTHPKPPAPPKNRHQGTLEWASSSLMPPRLGKLPLLSPCGRSLLAACGGVKWVCSGFAYPSPDVLMIRSARWLWLVPHSLASIIEYWYLLWWNVIRRKEGRAGAREGCRCPAGAVWTCGRRARCSVMSRIHTARGGPSQERATPGN